MKIVISYLAKGTLLSLLVLFAVSPAQAQSTRQCVCHNVLHNPVEVCSDDDSYRVGHGDHLEDGFDTEGTCPIPTATNTPTPTPNDEEPTPTPTDEDPPAVPEFGFLTGLTTLAFSTGTYFMLKRKV